MTKFVRLDTKITDAAAPFAVLTPGVAGYSDQYVARHVQGPAGTTVPAWAPSGSGSTLTAPGGGTGPVTIQEQSGLRFLRAPGGAGQGRLLGPNKGTLPFTIAAVVRAPNVNTTAVVGANGAAVNRHSSGNWSSTGGVSLSSTVNTSGWVFVLLSVDAAKAVTLRVGSQEVSGASTLTPPASFSGAYFGPASAGTQADILHLAFWPSALSATDRAAVHEFMRARYPVIG